MLMLGALLLSALVSASQADTEALARAETLLAKQDYKGAEAALRDYLKTDPSNARAHGNLALALLQQKKIHAAVDEARLAAAFGPNLPEARYIYGLALRADGRPLEAARELERALALKPEQIGALRALAAVYAAQEDPRTIASYEKLIVLEPDKPAHRAELAEYLWTTGKSKDGNRVVTEALVVFPANSDLLVRQGRALFDQGRYLDAAATLAAARAGGSRDASTAALLAEAEWQAGRTDAALKVLEEAGASRPQDARILSDRGKLLLSLGKAQEAIPPLEELASLRPSDAETRLDLGRAYEMLGRLADAEASYRLAIKLAPNSPRAHYALGRLLMRGGDKAEAERELAAHQAIYDRAQKLVFASQQQSGEAAMAWAELNDGKAAEALKRFERLPPTSDALLGQAAALSRLQRHREAVAALEKAHQTDPDNKRIDLLLATERSRAEAP